MFDVFVVSAIFITLYTIPSIAISIIQIKYIKAPHKVVILNDKDFDIAREYAIASQYFKIAESIIGAIIFVFWFDFGLKALEFNEGLLKGEFITQVACVMGFLLINSLLSMPLDAYKTLVLDKAFGFTKSNIKLYLLDYIKSFLMLAFVGTAIVSLLVYIIEEFALWWLLGFVLIFCVAIIINLIYPTIIAPLFNKFTLLNDEDLKAKITEMMNKVGFRANGIFVMDASKRDGRLNAYFGGLGRSKRVVLFDTLLSKVSHNELLAILGHELAHFKHKDLFKNIAIMAVMLFVLFFIAGHLPQILFSGIKQNAVNTLCVLMLITNAILFYFLPMVNYFSRKAEYKADEFGSKLTNKQDLCNALIKLVNENKSFPYSSGIYTFFYLSHPPLIERLKVLGFSQNDNQRTP